MKRAPVWALVAVVIVVVAGIVIVQAPPWSFLTRPDLHSCGEITPSDTGDLPVENVQCLFTADDGAELKVTVVTDEGDPIHTYYRNVPGRDGLEVFTDSRDRYGDESWTHEDCAQATSISDTGDCTQA